MPHIIIKIAVGLTEQEKESLANALTEVIMTETGNNKDAISVSIEDIQKENWYKQVYEVYIKQCNTLYKKPGYKIKS